MDSACFHRPYLGGVEAARCNPSCHSIVELPDTLRVPVAMLLDPHLAARTDPGCFYSTTDTETGRSCNGVGIVVYFVRWARKLFLRGALGGYVEKRKLIGAILVLIGFVVMIVSYSALQRAQRAASASFNAEVQDAMSKMGTGNGTGSGVNVGGGNDSAAIPLLVGLIIALAGAALIKFKFGQPTVAAFGSAGDVFSPRAATPQPVTEPAPANTPAPSPEQSPSHVITGAQSAAAATGADEAPLLNPEPLPLTPARSTGAADPPTADKTYLGTVLEVLPFGARVEIAPGFTGLLHVVDFSSKPVRKIGDHLKVGSRLLVKVVEVTDKSIKLSKTAAVRDLLLAIREASPSMALCFTSDDLLVSAIDFLQQGKAIYAAKAYIDETKAGVRQSQKIIAELDQVLKEVTGRITRS